MFQREKGHVHTSGSTCQNKIEDSDEPVEKF